MIQKTAVKKTDIALKGTAFTVSPADAFLQYSNSVYRLAFVRTANKSDADDILSEVFLRLIKNSHKIKSEEHLKAWLLRVTVNCSNSLLSSAHKKHFAELNEAAALALPETNEVLPAVLKLPYNQRTVIYMHYIEGYSVEEISKICSIPVGTVKSRLSRGRDSLKALLEGVDL